MVEPLSLHQHSLRRLDTDVSGVYFFGYLSLKLLSDSPGVLHLCELKAVRE